MKEEEEVTDEVVAEEEETTDEVVAEEDTTEEEVVSEEEVTEEEVVAEYDIEEDVNALLSGEELSEEFQEKARTIFEQQSTLRLLKSKKNWKQSMQNSLQKKLFLQKNHSLSELILTLSMLLTNGSPRTNSQLKQVSRLK